MKQATNEQLQN